jgi:hypothetical protein
MPSNLTTQGIDDWVYSKKEYRDLALSSKDWERLTRLRDILEVCEPRFSSSGGADRFSSHSPKLLSYSRRHPPRLFLWFSQSTRTSNSI